jgi:hypothetical protein
LKGVVEVEVPLFGENLMLSLEGLNKPGWTLGFPKPPVGGAKGDGVPNRFALLAVADEDVAAFANGFGPDGVVNEDVGAGFAAKGFDLRGSGLRKGEAEGLSVVAAAGALGVALNTLPEVPKGEDLGVVPSGTKSEPPDPFSCSVAMPSFSSNLVTM